MNRNKLLLILGWLLCLSGCKTKDTTASVETFQHLDSLFRNHQYFQLRDTLLSDQIHLNKKEELLLRAKLYSVFNERELSNDLIEQLFSDHGEELSEKERMALLETKVNNSVFLFDYASALKTTEEVLSIDSLDPEKRKEHQNVIAIYKALEKAPAQTAQVEGTELPITKDLAGLSRIPVTINQLSLPVVFDTGANFSVITDSLAIQAGIEIIGESFKVKAVTGGEVDSRIGIADSLRLGNTLLENVVFLVFPYESLSFPEANYTIDAILGFPVINGLGEIMLIDGEEFHITATASKFGDHNLALDFLTPIVEVHENGSSLAFTFDTGANSTAFYSEYFNLRRDKILNHGIKDSLRFGGAGGVIKVPVYKVPFSGRIGDSHFSLDNAAVQQTATRDYPGIYGNLGQDVLSQFDTLVLDFREMRFLVK